MFSRLSSRTLTSTMSASRTSRLALALAQKNANVNLLHVQRRRMSNLRKSLDRYGAQIIDPTKTSLMFSVADGPGALKTALDPFWKYDVNLTAIESKPGVQDNHYDFFVSFEGRLEDENVAKLIAALKTATAGVEEVAPISVPWFPVRVEDIDLFAHQTLDAGAELEADHPGFHDQAYRERREMLAAIALNHRHGNEVPRIDYTDFEVDTWRAVYQRLIPLHEAHACKEHLAVLPELMRECGYSEDNIPQIADISAFLEQRTGFTLRPVSGLFSPRHFLYGLAFRVFSSTQYIRHHSKPLYTPEPDVVHELLGHVPLLADPDFADFSQAIGLASIGASDDQIRALARCYWYSVEFGLCEEDGQRKAFGAGLLSSFGELEYSMTDEPEVVPWDPFDAAKRDYPITRYQPTYYIAKSFADAKESLLEFSKSMSKPFNVKYNRESRSLIVDRNLAVETDTQDRITVDKYKKVGDNEQVAV